MTLLLIGRFVLLTGLAIVVACYVWVAIKDYE